MLTECFVYLSCISVSVSGEPFFSLMRKFLTRTLRSHHYEVWLPWQEIVKYDYLTMVLRSQVFVPRTSTTKDLWVFLKTTTKKKKKNQRRTRLPYRPTEHSFCGMHESSCLSVRLPNCCASHPFSGWLTSCPLLRIDIWWLAAVTFIICIIEREKLQDDENHEWFTVFHVCSYFLFLPRFGLI